LLKSPHRTPMHTANSYSTNRFHYSLVLIRRRSDACPPVQWWCVVGVHACGGPGGDCRSVLPGARSVELWSSACSALCAAYSIDRADTSTSSNLPCVCVFTFACTFICLCWWLNQLFFTERHHSSRPNDIWRPDSTYTPCFFSSPCHFFCTFVLFVSEQWFLSLTYPSTRPCDAPGRVWTKDTRLLNGGEGSGGINLL
jgi:hypothetical protein